MQSSDADGDSDLHSLLMKVNLWHLFGPLRDAGETLASLQGRLNSDGRSALLKHLRSMQVWNFNGDRKVSISFLESQKIINELVKREHAE